MKSILPLAFSACFLAALSAPAAETPEIIRGQDNFEFSYRVKLPALDLPARMWLPLPVTGRFQVVRIKAIDSPLAYEIVKDRNYDNAMLLFSPAPGDSGKVIEIRYEVRRDEKESYLPAPGDDPQRYLAPERLTPADARFGQIAAEVAPGGSAPTDAFDRASAFYRHVLHEMKYDKTGVGWGRGDALRACDAHTGNCTDFHSYFIALARAAGIPARFAIGAIIPAGAAEGDISGYHCWAEFYARGKWTPVDISEAWKHPELADYYFGHQPANRFEISAGRDLTPDPAPAAGPLNFLVYAYLESGGKEIKTETQFHFRRIKS